MSLSSEQIKFLYQKVVAPLKQYDATVFLFGSRATNTNHEYSDVDLLIQAKKTEPLKAAIAEIKEILVESSFPYKVDIVLEADIAESYRENIKSQLVGFSELRK